MKILLVYPRLSTHAGGLQEPLGILYIATSLKRSGHYVDVVDLVDSDTLDVLREKVLNSDLVGMSSSTAIFGEAKKVLSYIKKINPCIVSIIGGPHATALPSDAIDSGFDYAIIGEGEETIVELVEVIDKKKSMMQVKGIAFREEGNVRINEPREFIKDLDMLPIPDRSLLPYDMYFKHGMVSIGIMAMRGCPYNCLFCKPMQNKLFGKVVRRRTVENVVDEIENIQRQFGEEVLISFKDDTFTTNSTRWFIDFGRELKKRGLSVEWGCQSRVNQIHYDLLLVMKNSGCKSIAFGVESGSQKILNYYRKGITIDQIVKAFELCHKLKIRTHAYIMLGAPIETRDDLDLTLKLINKIKPEGISQAITTPAPGTDLYAYAEEHSIFNTKDYEKMDYYHNEMPMNLEFLTREDLIEYQKKIDRYRLKRKIILSFTSFSEFRRTIETTIKNPSKIKSFIKRGKG